MRGTKRPDGMIEISQADYNAIGRDFRGVWDTERDDLPNWDKVRDKYMGKRTMMSGDGTCTLLIEGLNFVVVG